jgi:hypothetical protein
VVPLNADAVLKRFRNTTSDEDETLILEPEGDKSSWRQPSRVFDAAVKDSTEESSRRLGASLHSLQVQNELLHHENKGLRNELTFKKKQKKKSKLLDLHQRNEYHGGGAFWSTRKVREARARESVRRQEDEAEKLQKAETRQLKDVLALYKKLLAEEVKAMREIAKEAREEERKQGAEEAAARRA